MTERARIKPQDGPQLVFSRTTADIAIYGGSAGGGKSFALCFEAGRYFARPGYAAVIFRRKTTELTGGGSIWEESRKLFPSLGGVPREHPTLDWTFPSGAIVEFRHLQHEHNVFDHQSKQYAFIGFDELTQFSAMQFWYLLSRNRSGANVPKRIRGTCNPDPDSFVRSLVAWWIGDDGRARDDRSGVMRWMVRLDEKLHWADSPEELVRMDPLRILPRGGYREPGDVRPEPMSLTFIRARASDNQVLMRADPGYVARLNLIPGAQARRLRDGDWNARDSAGDYFDRSWCKILERRPDPKNVKTRVRFWDKAATTPSSENPDPDWTRGVLVALTDLGDFVVEDVQSLRAGPAEVEARISATAEMDGVEVTVGAWQDPGQAGVVDVEHMRRMLAGYSFREVKATKDKTTYAAVWSPHAKAGKLHFVLRDYLPEVFAEAEGFPGRAHDDFVDALSGAFQLLFGGAFVFAYDAAPDPRRLPEVSYGEDDGDDDDDFDAGFGRARGAVF